jgi:hypothetical protein
MTCLCVGSARNAQCPGACMHHDLFLIGPPGATSRAGSMIAHVRALGPQCAAAVPQRQSADWRFSSPAKAAGT